MPNLYVIAGCNGSGKTTVAKTLLPDYFNCTEFVNADIMAEQLAPHAVASVAIKAARMTLDLVRKTIRDRMDFAVETTLSGLAHKEIIKLSREYEYEVILIYLWLGSVDMAIDRVKDRTELGGHNIPESDIVRRYKRGLVNLFGSYMWIVDHWAIIDNSYQTQEIVAIGDGGIDFTVTAPKTWIKLKSAYNEFKRA